MLSLRARQLLAASLVLAIFIALCGAGLERAFHSSAVEAEQDRLEGLVYAMLGAAETNENGDLTLSDERLPDPRLARPQSGLQAALIDERGALIWGSPSLEDEWSASSNQAIGSWHFQENENVFTLSFGLRWIGRRHGPRRYTLEVIENDHSFALQLATYRRTLWGWLGGAAAALLAVQLLVLNWSLTPLLKLTQELRDIEDGQKTKIEASYPTELKPLTGALNSMILNERNQLARYRNSLGDLAHSLKTPLAVLMGTVEDQSISETTQLRLKEPINRIQQIADYQLHRAAMAGRRTLSEPVLLKPLADKIALALGKVYSSKNLAIEVDIPPSMRTRVDQGDLYEMLGNLLDNACKWAKYKIRISASLGERSAEITVDDDGAGFPEDAEKLLARGVRADDQVPGQGIGLSAVHELAIAYDGSISLQKSPLGGARVVLKLQT
jgi:two-component system sensor histidine kinase PhoQ